MWQVVHAERTLLLRTTNLHALSDDEPEAIAPTQLERLEAEVVAALARETAMEAAEAAEAARRDREATFEATQHALDSLSSIDGHPISPAGV